MLKIENRVISLNSNPLIIAEIGINHKGNLNLAFNKSTTQLIRAGAEIVKHQTHTINDEMSEEAKKIKPGNLKQMNMNFEHLKIIHYQPRKSLNYLNMLNLKE